MATYFQFDTSSPQTAKQLERADLTTGSRPESWFDYDGTAWVSAISPDQSIAGGLDVFAVTMVQGQTYELDIDLAQLDLQMDIVDQTGRLVATHDGGDNNAFLEFTAAKTGQYYVAIRHSANDYLGNFTWERDTAQTGNYEFSFAASNSSTYQAPASRTYNLSESSNSFQFTESADEVRGNGGNDYLLLLGGNDIALGGTGNDSIYGGTGMDDLMGSSGSDRLYGGDGDDVIRGGTETDYLYGDAGRDGLLGGDGSDALIGGASHDTLSGEAGNDALRGGSGIDILFGGAGADKFIFTNGESTPSSTNTTGYLDSVQDFSRAQADKIDLRYAFGDDDSGFLAWRGSSSFTGSNQVRAVGTGNGYVEVQVNLGGTLAADMEFLVRLAPGATFGSTDFLL